VWRNRRIETRELIMDQVHRPRFMLSRRIPRAALP
jgi:hypothetical protein